MDPLNQTLFQLLKYIHVTLVPGEPIEITKIIERLQDLHLLTEEEVTRIYEVLA